MSVLIQNLIMPIFFSIDRLPHQHHIELCFSKKPEKKLGQHVTEDKIWPKADQLYRKHHTYGDHRYLIPALHEMSNQFFITQSNAVSAFKQIGTDPTTTVVHQKLQLLTCSEHNLSLFQSQLQSAPFYIEIAKRTFFLYVWHQGMYWKIPCHRHAPLNMQGRTYPVITLEINDKAFEFSYLNDIPWPDIAQQLGNPIQLMQNTMGSHVAAAYGNFAN